jgi:hypothetical protein
MRQGGRIVQTLKGVCLVLALSGVSMASGDFAWGASADNDVKLPGALDKTAPAPSRDAATLLDKKAKGSYALGMLLGNQLISGLLDVDRDLYLQGLKDVLSGGGTLLTEQDARAVVKELQQEMKEKQAAAAAPTDIKVSFRLDPRLTQGLYMGERWVSPPTYTMVQEGKTCTIDAQVPGAAPKGKSKKISPRWIPSDPGMVTVSPSTGNRVKITVKRDGESTLKVALPTASKDLSIKAAYQDNAIRVDITQ